MAKCMKCRAARGTHYITGKTVCQECYDILAATPDGLADMARRAKKSAARDEIAAAEAARKAALTEDERMRESDRESAKIKAQNAGQGKYVPYDDPARIRRAD